MTYNNGNNPWGEWIDQVSREFGKGGPRRSHGWQGGPGWGGPGWQGGHHGRGRGPAGPPPWISALLGFDNQPPQRPGPRVRRGDVRSAIIYVLAEAAEQGQVINGYQVIQQISERSSGEWRPSPGSVYPTIQQLEDEGLVESDDEHGRRAIRLSETGKTYAAEHADELAAVWKPFDKAVDNARAAGQGGRGGQGVGDLAGFGILGGELAQVLPAVWQLATSGTDSQRQAAADILADTRRKLYGLLAAGDDEHTVTAEQVDETEEIDEGEPGPDAKP
ncbi:DNA-binding PadR family transcriptional regulator [Nocardioides luteus]|uniref:Transcriptional regulator n=1 Tax=Nocardioides luteus TaxID=1844 RepID=A0ABQ5SRG8_9ACTN|nr:PadR family transcriptional regulator [Nocardioides luteus]MDR7313190.1 DNA-binding PadR family transcriptional regulator [Nocardioides luteus]GGR43449.1 transcriptional regulator [Nocardioides luteus]GLJ66255.1 transcriptional regulator [Nocardioides luteus]